MGEVSEWLEGHAVVDVEFFRVQVEVEFNTKDTTSFVTFDDFSVHLGSCGSTGGCRNHSVVLVIALWVQYYAFIRSSQVKLK